MKRAISGMACGIAAWILTQMWPLHVLDQVIADRMLLLRGVRGSSANVILVGLDDASSDELQKPQVYISPELADIVAFLADRKVAAIGLDLLLPESNFALPELQRGGAGDATRLGDAIQDSGNIVLPLWKSEGRWLKPLPQWRKKSELNYETNDLGFVNVAEDADGHVRRQQLYVRDGEDAYMSFSLALASRATSGEVQWLGNSLSIGAHRVPLDDDQMMRINFVGPPGTFPVIPFRDVLRAARDGTPLYEDFAGSVVIIGRIGPSSQDQHPTPYRRLWGRPTSMSGIELQANVAATLIDRSYISSPSWSNSLLMLVLLGGLLRVGIDHASRLGTLFGFLISSVTVIAAYGALCLWISLETLRQGGLQIDTFGLLLLGVLVFVVHVVTRRSQVTSRSMESGLGASSSSQSQSSREFDADEPESPSQRSTTMQDSAVMRRVILQRLSDVEFADLCFDDFRAIHNEFTEGQSRSTRVRILVEYAENHQELDKLAAALRSVNAAAYEEYLTQRRSEKKASEDSSEPSDPEGFVQCDVLVLAANPKASQRLQLEEEAEQIRERLGEGKPGRKVCVIASQAVKVNDITRLLLQHEPRVVHFAGHGTQGGALIFEDEHGTPSAVSAEALGKAFTAVSGRTECVTLNACYSAVNADALADSVRCVVGMTSRVDDESSRRFSGGFYRGLAFGQDYRTAFELGCAEIGLHNLPDTDQPAFVTRDVTMYDPAIAVSRISIRAKRSTPTVRASNRAPSVTVWFGTNRRLNDSDRPERGFGSERDDKTNYGTCEVVVPTSHKEGELGSAFWWRLVTLTDDRIKLDWKSIRLSEGAEFWSSLRSDLRELEPSKRHALVFLHGYNVSFEDAARRSAQIATDLPFPGPTAFFSWPSRGRLIGYAADADAIEYSKPMIAEFLIGFVRNTGADRIHLLAHSMGNRGLLNAMSQVIAEIGAENRPTFDQIFLAAPDVDVDIFRQRCGVYQSASQKTTIYASPRDRAVWASSLIHLGGRIGYHPPISVFDGIDTIRVDDFDLLDLGHGYVASAKSVLADMNQAIRHNATPEDRRLKSALCDAGRFWHF